MDCKQRPTQSMAGRRPRRLQAGAGAGLGFLPFPLPPVPAGLSCWCCMTQPKPPFALVAAVFLAGCAVSVAPLHLAARLIGVRNAVLIRLGPLDRAQWAHLARPATNSAGYSRHYAGRPPQLACQRAEGDPRAAAGARGVVGAVAAGRRQGAVATSHAPWSGSSRSAQLPV